MVFHLFILKVVFATWKHTFIRMPFELHTYHCLSMEFDKLACPSLIFVYSHQLTLYQLSKISVSVIHDLNKVHYGFVLYIGKKQGRNEFVIRLQPSEAMYMKLTVCALFLRMPPPCNCAIFMILYDTDFQYCSFIVRRVLYTCDVWWPPYVLFGVSIWWYLIFPTND